VHYPPLRLRLIVVSWCRVSDHQWLNSAGMGRNGVPQPVSGVPPPEIAVPPPTVVTPPPGDALMVHTVFLVS